MHAMYKIVKSNIKNKKHILCILCGRECSKNSLQKRPSKKEIKVTCIVGEKLNKKKQEIASTTKPSSGRQVDDGSKL